jgi:hypothetical protein
LKENILDNYITTDSRSADKFVVRLPDGLRADIAELSRRNDRSMNSEIINRLKRSITSDQLSDTQGKMIDLLLKRIEELEIQFNSAKGAA